MKSGESKQKKLTYFVRGPIAGLLDSVALLMFNQQQIYLFGQIQTIQTGGQHYEVSECSLVKGSCPSQGNLFHFS